ncbi:MAG: hypothetical protein ACYC35_18715 [Pirellulales bacterium]
MVYRGRVKNGVVILDDPVQLPEGTEVEVDLPIRSTGEPLEGAPTLYDRLKPVIGMAEGLPADLAENHDHYLHGTPKR